MERDAEETTFVVVRIERDQPAGEVEERRRVERAVVEDADLAGLLDEKHPAGPVIRREPLHRRRDAGENGLQLDADWSFSDPWQQGRGGWRRRRCRCGSRSGTGWRLHDDRPSH